MHKLWSLHLSFLMFTTYLERRSFPNFIAKKVITSKWWSFTRVSHKDQENSKTHMLPPKQGQPFSQTIGLGGQEGLVLLQVRRQWHMFFLWLKHLQSMAVPGLPAELGRHLSYPSGMLWAACPVPLSSPAKLEACGQFPAGPGVAFPKKSACSLPT